MGSSTRGRRARWYHGAIAASPRMAQVDPIPATLRSTCSRPRRRRLGPCRGSAVDQGKPSVSWGRKAHGTGCASSQPGCLMKRHGEVLNMRIRSVLTHSAQAVLEGVLIATLVVGLLQERRSPVSLAVAVVAAATPSQAAGRPAEARSRWLSRWSWIATVCPTSTTSSSSTSPRPPRWSAVCPSDVQAEPTMVAEGWRGLRRISRLPLVRTQRWAMGERSGRLHRVPRQGDDRDGLYEPCFHDLPRRPLTESPTYRGPGRWPGPLFR